MTLRIPAVLAVLLSFPSCINVPIGVQGPGGAPPMATTPGPTAASLPPPGSPMTPATCAQYRATAARAGMMTPQLDASLHAQGC